MHLCDCLFIRGFCLPTCVVITHCEAGQVVGVVVGTADIFFVDCLGLSEYGFALFLLGNSVCPRVLWMFSRVRDSLKSRDEVFAIIMYMYRTVQTCAACRMLSVRV